MIMMASGEKQKVQEALEKFLMMALEKDPGGVRKRRNEEGRVLPVQDKVRNVGAVLGAARAYVALKLVPKAKQLLKRVMDFPWTLTDAEHLEMCTLRGMGKGRIEKGLKVGYYSLRSIRIRPSRNRLKYSL